MQLRDPDETEVKFKLTSLEAARNAAVSAGAQFVDRCRQYDRYMRHPCRESDLSKEELRLRRESGSRGNRYELTYKGPKDPLLSVQRPHPECQIDDPEEMEEILFRLGFSLLVEVRKTREKYLLGKFEISIDDVDDLGLFIEVELVTKEELSKEAVIEMTSLARKLGAVGPRRLKSYAEMVLEEKPKGK